MPRKEVEPIVFEPTEFDISRADHGAVEYVCALSILNHPESTAELHGSDADLEPEIVVGAAARLMLSGLTLAIQHANPPGHRSAERMRPRYEQAKTHLLETQKRLYGADRDYFFPAIKRFEPFPVLDKPIYERFSHGSFGSDKLLIAAMMGRVPIDGRLRDLCMVPWRDLRKLSVLPQPSRMSNAA